MKTCALILAAAILAMAAPAYAAQHGWQIGNEGIHVVLSDLNLQTVSGRAVALARVEAAAVRVCGDGGVLSEQRACVAKTVTAAITNLTDPVLRLAYAERSAVQINLAQAK